MSQDAELGAYVDGELDAAAARAFEARMAHDPALAARVEQHRALRARLDAAFDPVLSEPVPARLVAAATTSRVTPLGRRGPWWAAMAACLALGVIVGRGLVFEQGVLQVADGRLTASGALRQALDQQLAAEQQGRPIQVGLSFKTAQGDYCRTFESAPDRLAGVACHEGDRWIARLTAAYDPPATQGYRTAASQTPAPVLAAVDAMIAGQPLDQPAERAARARGWTR